MNKQKKFGLGKYLKNHVWGIIGYIVLLSLITASQVIITIIAADAIEMGTLKQVEPAIRGLLNVLALTVMNIALMYMMDFIYFKVSTEIVSELNLDLAKQAFKLNSRTYTDHGTGVFVSRIINDPMGIIQNLVNIVDRIASVAKALFMTAYIIILDKWIGLILVATIIIGSAIEAFRVKKLRKNTIKVKKLGDKINSLTTEIVRSEKDIKSLGLEDKLGEVSKSNYEEYKKATYKKDMTDMNFYSSRNLFLELVGIAVLVLGVIMIDKALLTLASFMIIYSNNGSLYHFAWCIGAILNIFGEIKVCSKRMFALFDEDEYVTEKFGNIELENVKGAIEFKNVKFTFIEYEDENPKEKK